MPTSVKYFHADMEGAPILNGVAGSLISVLNACLKDGFGLKSVSSIVVSGGVATAALPSGVGAFEQGTVALVAGSSVAALNGEKRLLSASGSHVTFAAPGVADQTVTGSLTASLAPAGWESPFPAAGNVAAYRSKNVRSTRMWLRVDDTAATFARVVGYESMSGLSTGTGMFPTNAQVSGGYHWGKASAAAGAARKWIVIADDRTFWLWVNTAATSNWNDGMMVSFGDFAPTVPGDPYACSLSGTSTNLSASTTANVSTAAFSAAVAQLTLYIARNAAGVPAGVSGFRRGGALTTVNSYSAADASARALPAQLPLTPMIVFDFSTLELRGLARGILYCPATLVAASLPGNRETLSAGAVLPGRTLMAVRNSGASAATAGTTVTSFFDITGPW